MNHSTIDAVSPIEYMETDEPDEPSWTCMHCTFINRACGDSCEMCGLPKQ